MNEKKQTLDQRMKRYLMSRKGRDVHAVPRELGFVQNFERH